MMMPNNEKLPPERIHEPDGPLEPALPVGEAPWLVLVVEISVGPAEVDVEVELELDALVAPGIDPVDDGFGSSSYSSYVAPVGTPAGLAEG